MAVQFGKQAARYFTRPHVAVPTQALSTPAAWYGADFADRLPVSRFTDDEIEELETVAGKLVGEDASIHSVGREDFPLERVAPRLHDAIEEVAHGRGFVVLRGLPVERWGESLTSMVCWGLGHVLGEPGEQNPDGERLGHVRDYGEEAEHPMVRRYRTSGNIDFHCDGADAVGLLCLRTAQSGGQSRIASSVTVFNELLAARPDLVARLFEPMHLDRRDEERPGQPPCTPIQPACFDGEVLRTFYHSEYYRSAERHPGYGLDAAARALLDAYDQIANREDVRLDIWLEPGDLQIVSNHTVVHARTAYVDHESRALKRHLLRLWLSFRGEQT